MEAPWWPVIGPKSANGSEIACLQSLAAQWKRVSGLQLGNQAVLKLLNAGEDAEKGKRRGGRTSISPKKTVNLLEIKMNGKKEQRKMKGPINVETKINMKKSMKANTKLNMNINMKKTLNTMLQVERSLCSFAGHPSDQIKTRVQERAASRRVPRRPPTMKCKASHSEAIPADVHRPDEAEMSR
jgi:hypothetical protein